MSTAASEVASDIGSFIRTQRENAQVSVRQLAERSGVSNPYLSQVERGLRKPSADVLNQIAKALRVSAEVLYVQAGMLEPSDKSQVRDAIITDTAITERQKQVLLDIYASFTAPKRISLMRSVRRSRTPFPPTPASEYDANSLSMSRSRLDQRPLGYPEEGVYGRATRPTTRPSTDPTNQEVTCKRVPRQSAGLDYSREPSLAPPLPHQIRNTADNE